MTLLSVRTQFRSVSGRYDLVNSDYSDNGADFYINAGQRFLDQLTRFMKAPATVFLTPDTGKYFTIIDNNRTIEEVWAADATARWKLGKVSMSELKALYAKPFGDVDNSKPKYYTHFITRTSPESDASSIDALTGYGEMIAADQHTKKALVWMPPAEANLQIEVHGKFYSPNLSNDSDKSYWTEQFPDLLLQAALYKIETIYHRNSEGARDMLNALIIASNEITKDLIEEEIAEFDQMEG